MYDKNASGSIDVNEFQQLFSAINQWKAVFQGYDKDKSGTIEQSELTQGNGYVYNPRTFENGDGFFGSNGNKYVSLFFAIYHLFLSMQIKQNNKKQTPIYFSVTLRNCFILKNH